MKGILAAAFVAFGVCLALFLAASAVDSYTEPERIRAETDAARANIDAERGRTENQIRMMETESRLRFNDQIWERIDADHSWLIFGVFTLAALCLFLFFRLYAEVRTADAYKLQLEMIENKYRIESIAWERAKQLGRS